MSSISLDELVFLYSFGTKRIVHNEDLLKLSSVGGKFRQIRVIMLVNFARKFEIYNVDISWGVLNIHCFLNCLNFQMML